MSIKNIILATGGTGGHIFPAIAVAQEIKKRNPDAIILFMGAKKGVEADIAANAGFDFAGLPVKGIMGKGLKGLINAFAMLRGITTAAFIIKKVKPQLVMGFGGYAAFAGTYAGHLLSKKTAIHEQNSFPGMANKVLGKRVNRVFISMPGSEKHFSEEKTVFTGNPIRENIATLYDNFKTRQFKKTEKASPRLLVTGGSLGAKALNEVMCEIAPELIQNGVDLWHQTGADGYDYVRSQYRKAGVDHVRVESFINDMATAYEWADLILCRAGASSLAEITAVGLPAILVPFPFAVGDHQKFNAQALEKKGAALCFDQKEISGENKKFLYKKIMELLFNPETLGKMAEQSHLLAKPRAAAEIVDELEKIL